MIEFKSVNYGYKRREELFESLNLRFDEGHIHGLLGCNGSGKTTMMCLAMGLLVPRSGKLRVDGKDPAKRSKQTYDELMIIPEELSLPSLSIDRYMHLTAPFYSHFSADDFDYYCTRLNVDRRKNLRSMSMGERKKGYTAFALACNCRNLLLDEPTNGLDIPSKVVFRELTAGYAADNRTVIVSTHQVREVEELIDNVVIIDHKGLVMSGSIEQIGQELSFGLCRKGDNLLYSEQTAEGIRGVAVNHTGAEGPVNLELLFQAATTQRQTIVELFKNNTDHENA